MQCNDGWPSPSDGGRGTCSHHGGVTGETASAPFVTVAEALITGAARQARGRGALLKLGVVLGVTFVTAFVVGGVAGLVAEAGLADDDTGDESTDESPSPRNQV